MGPPFILLLRQILAKALNIDATRVLGTIVTENSVKKRQSDLETELEVTVTPSMNDSSGEPSASQAVQDFINNQTSIANVQQEIPELEEIIGKPTGSKI